MKSIFTNKNFTVKFETEDETLLEIIMEALGNQKLNIDVAYNDIKSNHAFVGQSYKHVVIEEKIKTLPHWTKNNFPLD